jgi:hypothetical protein
MRDLMAARLPAMYQRLASVGTLVQGGEERAVRVIVNRQPGFAMDASALLGDTTARMQVAEAPAGVARGDVLLVDDEVWEVRETFQPLIDGLELQGALRRVS